LKDFGSTRHLAIRSGNAFLNNSHQFAGFVTTLQQQLLISVNGMRVKAWRPERQLVTGAGPIGLLVPVLAPSFSNNLVQQYHWEFFVCLVSAKRADPKVWNWASWGVG
jgi:hypothetical protein